MWKTDCWSLHLASLERHLCPHCDSLGPHCVVTDEQPSRVLLECIDCGALLGRLTPQGVEPLGDTGSSEPIMTEARHRSTERDAGLGGQSEKAGSRQPQSVCETLQRAFLAGLIFKARR
jgi:hypothetical protein